MNHQFYMTTRFCMIFGSNKLKQLKLRSISFHSKSTEYCRDCDKGHHNAIKHTINIRLLVRARQYRLALDANETKPH